MYLLLHPSEIRFSQDTISYKFQPDKNGKEYGDCNTAVVNILNGKLSADDFPTIQVAEIDDDYFTLDNRRLYVFRAVQYHRPRFQIKVKVVSEQRLMYCGHDTTENDGETVKIRYCKNIPNASKRCKTLPHSRPSWFEDDDKENQLPSESEEDEYSFTNTQRSRNEWPKLETKPVASLQESNAQSGGDWARPSARPTNMRTTYSSVTRAYASPPIATRSERQPINTPSNRNNYERDYEPDYWLRQYNRADVIRPSQYSSYSTGSYRNRGSHSSSSNQESDNGSEWLGVGVLGVIAAGVITVGKWLFS